LKPVIREELLKAIEKCVKTPEQPGVTYKGNIDFSGDAGEQEQIYVPVCVYPMFCRSENEQIRHLIHFSLLSFLEEYFEENKDGIVFQKENRIVVVLQTNGSMNVSEKLEQIKEGAENATGYQILLICGDEIHSMQEIPEMFPKCVEKEGYLFFADQMKYAVISWKGILSHQQELIRDGMTRYRQMVCRLSNGRKEDALFYYCTLIQSLEEILSGKGAKVSFPKHQELLEKGRSCVSFSEMEQIFMDVIDNAYNGLGESVTQNDKKDINKALEYIELHYAESLSLNVLAEEVHMNPYYFSSFFKKSTGKNFKDYVNQIRLKHAVTLLLDTDKKVYEIAMNVGFGDARAFNDAFQRAYGETPAGYRKRLRK